MNAATLADWIPIRVYRQADRFMVDWCYLGQERLTDPFFEQTLAHQLRLPFNQLFRPQTTLDELVELAAARSGVPPAGFIFHLSRCGSTLVAQMLASLPQNIVLSEARPIDAVLQASSYDQSITEEQRVTWLRAMVNVLAWPRCPGERQCFIKFDSWHMLDLALIQRAFPGVPWIFLYRNPVEVLVSHARMIGSQMVPGSLDPALFGLTLEVAAQMPPAEYGGRVLAAFCAAALQQCDTNGLFVEYRQLPDAVWTTLAGHFKQAWTDAEIDRMRRAAQFDAKNPSQRFEEDARKKNSAATDGMRRLAAQYVDPLYAQLEIARTAAKLNDGGQPLHLAQVRMEQVGTA